MTWSGTSTASSLRQASATPRNSSAPTASAPRWRAASPRTCSATTTTPRAGLPTHHPITGKTIGAVDLTCWRKDADPLLVALVKTTADQITQALLTDSSAQELELLQEYLRACRRTNGIVFALNDDVVMM